MNKITWQHLAGAAIGTSAGAGAGLGIGTFMIGQALTAPISFSLGGAITGFVISKKPFKGRVKNGVKYSALCLLGAPISAPMHILLAPLAAASLTATGAAAGFLLVEKAFVNAHYTKIFTEKRIKRAV